MKTGPHSALIWMARFVPSTETSGVSDSLTPEETRDLGDVPFLRKPLSDRNIACFEKLGVTYG